MNKQIIDIFEIILRETNNEPIVALDNALNCYQKLNEKSEFDSSKAEKLLSKVLYDNYNLEGEQYEIKPELRDEIESYLNDVPEYCDTPNACYDGGCMCERTNKNVETDTYVLLEDIEGLGEKDDKLEIPSHYNVWEYVTVKGSKRIDLENDSRIIKQLNIIQVDRIIEDPPFFVAFNIGGICEFIIDEEVKDVQTDEELTITRLETTDGTIYQV